MIIELKHRPVLKHEAVDALNIQGDRANACYVDGTFGRGGHSRRILQALGAKGRLIAFDKDPSAVAAARPLAIEDPRFSIVHDSFANLQQRLQQCDVREVAGILLDLGVSSPQVDDATRGFSFRLDGPLDMRMDRTRGESVAAWLALVDEATLRDVIHDYGEERFATQIARAIVAKRAVSPIVTTRQLAQIVASAVKTREKDKDPATRTFQALRIFINQELDDLEQGLSQAYDVLGEQGRFVVISFHSLEDRLVKQFFANKAHPVSPPRHLPLRAAELPRPAMRLIDRLKPSEAEVHDNPRARSAMMRVAEKVGSRVVGDAS